MKVLQMLWKNLIFCKQKELEHVEKRNSRKIAKITVYSSCTKKIVSIWIVNHVTNVSQKVILAFSNGTIQASGFITEINEIDENG